MCGKFSQMFSWAELFALYNIHADNNGDGGLKDMTPMGPAWIVRISPLDGARKRDMMRWGWGAGGNENYPKHIHARAETIDTLQTFRGAFLAGPKGRGVLFVDRFNVGEEVRTYYADGEDAQNPWTRQWRVRRKDGKPFPVGVIYEERDIGGAWRECFVMVTTAANRMISQITDRMPAVLNGDDLDVWFGETRAPIEDVKALLQPYEFIDGDWEMFVEDPAKKPPTRKRPSGSKPRQGDMF
jgi:putative SOS response-associated peptidase YedK